MPRQEKKNNETPKLPSLEDLPTSIVSDILSRLPIKTILRSTSVCKTWRDIISDPHFAKLHLPRSPNTLMIHQWGNHRYLGPGYLKLLDVEDDKDHHDLRYDHPVMTLDHTLGVAFKRQSYLLIVGSVNGWLCLWQHSCPFDNTYICNPVTQEYLILPKQQYYRQSYAIIVYGFGYSLSTGEYKVVRIFQGDLPPKESSEDKYNRPSLLEAEIYTIGTGKWRSLGRVPYWLDGFHGPFLNGFVHWFIIDGDTPEKICSFDMENESFHLFSSPPKSPEVDLLPDWNRFQTLGVIRGCLCKCDVIEFGLDIWVMKEYGVKKSWTKDFVVKDTAFPSWQPSDPIYVRKGMKDGTILFTYQEAQVFKYCPKTNAIENFEMLMDCANVIDFTPSFLRLGTFELENVHVF